MPPPAPDAAPRPARRLPGFRHRPGAGRGLPHQERRLVLPLCAGLEPPPNRPQARAAAAARDEPSQSRRIPISTRIRPRPEAGPRSRAPQLWPDDTFV